MKRKISIISAAAAAYLCLMTASADTAEGIRYITINGSSADRSENRAWQGIGGASTGGASSLLDDYKISHNKEYEEIVNILFRKGMGAGLSHIRVEMGSDVNSASGTEGCIMRTEDVLSDAPMSSCWQLAADAKAVNPSLTVTMSCKSEPRWVTDAFENGVQAGYNARYKWYKAHIEKAYKELELKIDCISADNGDLSEADPEWILYLSRRLDTESEPLYDYSKIKIIASDSSDGSGAAELMLSDEQLLNAVDIISCRYTVIPSESALTLSRKYCKELIFTDGISPTSADMYNKNGILNTAETIIGSICSGRMNMIELSPVVSAYYSGMRYFPSGLITADSPMSGAYEAEYGICTAAHFTAFTDIGWQPVNSACAYNGADISAMLPVKDNYITFTDPETGDYTTVISNSGTEDRKYVIKLDNINKADDTVYVWQTFIDENGELSLMENLKTISPENINGSYAYEFIAEAGTLTTLTTLNRSITVSDFCDADKKTLSLPYSDSFDTEDGHSPLYSHTVGGAFETENGALIQQLSEELRPADKSFGITPDPLLCLGDNTWKDLTAEITVKLESSEPDNYAGIGVRYNLLSEQQTAFSGYTFFITGSGEWKLFCRNELISSGIITGFSPDSQYILSLTAKDKKISACINNIPVTETHETGQYINSGMVSLVSGYYRNSFDGLNIAPADDAPYVKRMDNTCNDISFTGDTTDICDSSYTYFERSSTEISSGITIHDSPEEIREAFADIAFSEGNTVGFYGHGLENSKVFPDSSGYTAICTDDMITVHVPDDGRTHRIHVIPPSDGVIEYAVTGTAKEESSVEFEFDGTAFALIGECTERSEISIMIDGEEYSPPLPLDEAPPRSALFMTDGLENTHHKVRITVLKGSIYVDAVETDTAELIIKENNGAMPELTPIEQPKNEAAESETEYEGQEHTPVSGNTEEKNYIPVICIICGAGAAAGFIAVKKIRDNPKK